MSDAFFAQNTGSDSKSITAVKINSHIKIDGIADEAEWNNANVASNFTEYYPDNKNRENPEFKTEVRVLYDDTGIYIYGQMYDRYPDSILAQMTSRDYEGVADNFTVRLNPFNDAQQEFVFRVTAAGVQLDELFTIDNGSDESWDAIWSSRVSRDNKGWAAEIKIPYSAIRFPKNPNNTWSVNFMRKVQRNRQVFSWVFIDRKVSNTMLFTGSLTGIKDINPPTRLFLIPYSSSYINYYNGHYGTEFKAGADIKWGISDNFTLDAILIPDFGQTGFDDVEYVLGPFEQEFDEKRPFFTEGVDLFSKGNIVYTRRIGNISDYRPVLNTNEGFIDFPQQTKLINAVKVSGRTSGGLGIGVANAITDKAEAKIINVITGQQRSEIQTPISNYNIFVLDKRYGKNNSVSIINTNTYRNGHFSDANVSALLSDNYFLDNTYNLRNELKISTISGINKKNGFSFGSKIGEIKGSHVYGFQFSYVSKEFDINDLGINFYSDYSDYLVNYGYKILNSTKTFNSLNVNLNASMRFNNSTGKPEYARINLNFNSQNRKNNYYGFGIGGNPVISYDHYEPRKAGRYMKNFRNIFLWLGRSPNYNKKFLVELFPNIYFTERKGMWGYELNIEPRFRVNEKLVLTGDFELRNNHGDLGYASQIDSLIIIGQRDQMTLESELAGEFNFSPKSSMNLAFRHYWTTLKYSDFFVLTDKGDYSDSDITLQKDLSYNNWNIDLSWNYWFAPGSRLSLLYRHSIDSFDSKYDADLFNNLDYLFSQPQSHIFSMRISYFLDYNLVKKMYF